MDMAPILTNAPEGMLPILVDVAYKHIIDKGSNNSTWYISKNAATVAFVIKYLSRTGDKRRLASWLSLVPLSLHGTVLDRGTLADPFIRDEVYADDQITHEMLAGRYGHMRVLIDDGVISKFVVEAAVSFRDERALMICRDSRRFADRLHNVAAKEMGGLSDRLIMSCTTQEILTDLSVDDMTRMHFIAAIVIYRSRLLLGYFMKSTEAWQMSRLQHLVNIMVDMYCASRISRGCLYLAIIGYDVGRIVTERIVDDGGLDVLVVGGYMMNESVVKSYILNVDDDVCPARIKAIIEDLPEDEDGHVTIKEIHRALSGPRIIPNAALADVVIITAQ